MKRRLGGAALAVLALVTSGTATAAATTATAAQTTSGWHTVNAPDPHHNTVLLGVSCSSSNACTAVGDSYVGSGVVVISSGGSSSDTSAVSRAATVKTASEHLARIEQDQLLARGLGISGSGALLSKDRAFHGFAIAERWNGTAWVLQKLPRIPKSELAELNGVACPTANECLAVGDYFGARNFRTHALAEVWNGTTWRRVAIGNIDPLSISCVTATDCIAAGYPIDETSLREGERMRPVVEAWDGTQWHAVKLAAGAPNQFLDITAVACASSTSCEAYGGRESIVQVQGGINVVFHTFAEGWNGRRWAVQTTPKLGNLAETFQVVSGLACSTADHCVAVGSVPSGQAYRALVEVWNGSDWARQAVPDGGRTLLEGVGCAADAGCALVGVRVRINNQNYGHTVVYSGTGSGWTLDPTPSVKESQRGFFAVSAAGSGWVAVGRKAAGEIIEHS